MFLYVADVIDHLDQATHVDLEMAEYNDHGIYCYKPLYIDIHVMRLYGEELIYELYVDDIVALEEHRVLILASQYHE